MTRKLVRSNIEKPLHDIAKDVNLLRKESDDLSETFAGIASDDQDKIHYAVIGSSSLILFLLIGMGYYLRQIIILPVQRISGVLSELTSGNLNQLKLEVKSNDEMGVLSRSCNTLMDKLQGFIGFAERNVSMMLRHWTRLIGELFHAPFLFWRVNPGRFRQGSWDGRLLHKPFGMRRVCFA